MSYLKIWIHAVWGTKNRQPLLKPQILQQVCEHILSNVKTKGIFINCINGYDDHMHVLMLLHYDHSISKQMQLIKGESAFWETDQDFSNKNLNGQINISHLP